jgi:hypothetical protein
MNPGMALRTAKRARTHPEGIRRLGYSERQKRFWAVLDMPVAKRAESGGSGV